MNDMQEKNIPSNEQVVIPPELRARMDAAREHITAEVKQPEKDILERTAKLGLIDAMKEATLPHIKKTMEIKFKDLKVGIMAAISLVPILSTAGTAARAAEKATRMGAKHEKLVANAAKLDAKAAALARKSSSLTPTLEVINADKMAFRAATKARDFGVRATEAMGHFADKLTLTQLNKYKDLVAKGLHEGAAARLVLLPAERIALFEKEVSQGIKVASAFEHARKGIDTTKRWAPLGEKVIFGKKVEVPTGKLAYKARVGAEYVGETWFHKALHTIDPYPDVPGLVSMVGFLDLLPGVVGAELVPAAWQYVANKIQAGKEYAGMAKDMSKVVLSRLGVKFDKLKEPQVARAAETFVPGAATV